jgi:hypothetical protein
MRFEPTAGAERYPCDDLSDVLHLCVPFNSVCPDFVI